VKHSVVILGFCCLLGSLAKGQGHVVTADKPFEINRVADTSIVNALVRSGAREYSSEQEMSYLYWVNIMRRNPPAFHKQYVQSYLKQFPEAICDESRSLELEISGLSALPPLVPVRSLYIASSLHAAFLARTGRLSHDGEGGKSFPTRMEEAGVRSCAGEVIFDGKDDMLIAVILLLIDHRVPGVGHRKALLNTSFARTGVAVRFSREGRAVMVQDLSCPQ
jgi:uncharacterized protein YkwD